MRSPRLLTDAARRAQSIAFTVIGSMTFIPGARSLLALLVLGYTCRGRLTCALLRRAGFYYTRLAYYAYRGYEGYSYDDIPEVD